MVKRAMNAAAPPVAAMLGRAPYHWRPGAGEAYRRRAVELRAFRCWPVSRQKQYILQRMRRLVAHAAENVPFYGELYRRAGLSWRRLQRLEDLQCIPIVTKKMLRDTPLENRCWPCPDRISLNTGGSSGAALHFDASQTCLAGEWAHMHEAWSLLGYRPWHLMIHFAGRNPKSGRPVVFNALRNQYAPNLYSPREDILSALRPHVLRYPVRYLHGYPSAVFDFANYASRLAPDVVAQLRRTLRGVLLGSEYPVPAYRRRIEEVFGARTLSWYGHTEMAVLAPERCEEGLYEPYHTYGFAEVVGQGPAGRLVGTDWENLACPFIRYDTGDKVEAADTEDGLLRSFRITAGREGDFVLDRLGQCISLTGLIFGKHHAAFDRAGHVQICQDRPGQACLLVSEGGGRLSPRDLPALFDLEGVAIDFEYRLLSDPVRTAAGKVLLKVSPDQLAATAGAAATPGR